MDGWRVYVRETLAQSNGLVKLPKVLSNWSHLSPDERTFWEHRGIVRTPSPLGRTVSPSYGELVFPQGDIPRPMRGVVPLKQSLPENGNSLFIF